MSDPNDRKTKPNNTQADEIRAAQLARIRRAALFVELRMRVGRAVQALPAALTVALALAAGTLATRKTLPEILSEQSARRILIAAGALVVLTFIVSVLRRLPPRAGTLALDRYHDLHDRLTNALAFDAIKPDERAPLMEVAIDDALEKSKGLRPSKAAPIRFPKEMGVALLFAIGVAAIALLEVPIPRREAPQAKTIDALTMSPDDIELFKDAVKELAKDDQNPDTKAALDRFNQLIEDLANKRLDRTEAFRRMESIERELLKGAEADLKSLEDAFNEMGEELSKSDLSKKTGESFKKKDMEQAKKDLKELAEKLRESPKKKIDKAEIDKLRQALAKASAQRKEALQAINEKRAEAREELLRKKNEKQKEQDADAGAQKKREEEELLRKKERELERLDREAEQKERAGRKLDRLDRELAKAAEDLLRDLGMSADDLEQAAEDINRMQQEEMSQKEKEELRQRLQELRELLRQQGQGGKQRMARLKQFGKRARGGGKGQQGQGQEQGQGQQQQGQGQDGEGEDGEGQEGQQGQQGQQGQGQGQGKGQRGQQWVIGPGGKKILVLTQGGGQGDQPGQGEGQQGQGEGQQGQGGQGKEPGGKGIGSGHDPNLTGKRSDPKMGTQDVQAQGLDTQQGPSNSEVILSAAERGFKGGAYKRVFTQYHTVAEQQINKDTVPDGYRFYVHRYFQLIRPRE